PTAYAAPAGSASSRATARCSVGRPATTTCAGVSDGVPSSHGPVRTAPGHGADDGSGATGTPTSRGGGPGAPPPRPPAAEGRSPGPRDPQRRGRRVQGQRRGHDPRRGNRGPRPPRPPDG